MVFDLDESVVPDAPGATPQGEADQPGSGGARPARSRAQRLREAVVAGAVVVVAVGAWGVTTMVHEHQRQERLLAAPGGVLSLAQPLATRWTADTDAADATAFMPGLVVVRRGTALVALDATNGEERWQVEAGGSPACGQWWGRGTAGAADPLVCWSGPNATDATVTVVHVDGTAQTRALVGRVDAAAGTADGGLVVAERVGTPPPTPDAHVSSMPGGGYSVEGSVGQGQDVVLRLEDASTGQVHWERTVPFRPVADAITCGVAVRETDSGEQATVDLAQVSVVAYPDLVVVDGCGIRGAFALDGTPMSDPSASAWSWAEPYVDGGVLEQVGAYTPDSAVTSLLHGPDGAGVTTFSAPVLQPWATDGATSDLVLTGSGGVPLQGRGRDGTLRWQSVHTYTDVLVRTAGVVLAQRGDLALAGLDPRTGAELWARDDVLSDDPTAGRYDYVRSAFTDGAIALLAVMHDDPDGATELVAVDLSTGGVRWRTDAPDGWPTLLAVQGHLVEVVASGAGRYEDDGKGGVVVITPGTIAALG